MRGAVLNYDAIINIVWHLVIAMKTICWITKENLYLIFKFINDQTWVKSSTISDVIKAVMRFVNTFMWSSLRSGIAILDCIVIVFLKKSLTTEYILGFQWCSIYCHSPFLSEKVHRSWKEKNQETNIPALLPGLLDSCHHNTENWAENGGGYRASCATL